MFCSRRFDRVIIGFKAVRSEIDYWWTICVGFVSEEVSKPKSSLFLQISLRSIIKDIRNATELEHSTIDLLIDRGPRLCGELDKETVYSLHAKWEAIPSSDIDISYLHSPQEDWFICKSRLKTMIRYRYHHSKTSL